MDTQNDEKVLATENSENTALSIATDAVTTLVTGVTIPAPIRKNVFKAFDRLCSAVIDIPVSYLEGKSAEKRAETQARIKLISTGADQIATQMNVEPEYAHAAVKKYGQKILREQINLDKTCEVAADQILHEVINLKEHLEESEEKASINDDWLNNFEKEASLKSTEEMQLLFGRILAGEIQNPSSFSIKTVKLLARLDNEVAKLFQSFCSLCIFVEADNKIFDARVVSLGGNAGSNSLADYGLSFAQLNTLHEYGLIIPDYHSWQDYGMCIVNEEKEVSYTFKYQNQNWAFLPINNRTRNQELRFNGVALSNSGKELLKIVDIELNEKYTTALEEYFKSLDIKKVEVNIQ
jgi:hypothetical protein